MCQTANVLCHSRSSLEIFIESLYNLIVVDVKTFVLTIVLNIFQDVIVMFGIFEKGLPAMIGVFNWKALMLRMPDTNGIADEFTMSA